MAEASDRRHLERVLRDLGYRVDRHAGPTAIWKNGDGLTFALHTSPSDVRWLANCLAELRRRHPDSPVFRRRKASREQRFIRRARHRQRQSALAAVPDVAVKPAPVAASVVTGCLGCGRPWLSDLSPVGRACPACGGEVVIGRTETRVFKSRLAA